MACHRSGQGYIAELLKRCYIYEMITGRTGPDGRFDSPVPLTTSPEANRSQDFDQLLTNFNSSLELCAPYLFNLADQVIESDTERFRDYVIIGEDTSGRLPTRFIRKVLSGIGIDVPTAYICASQQARRQVPAEKYQQHITCIASRHCDRPNVLVVTDNTGTGDTANFIGKLLKPAFRQADLAILASLYTIVPSFPDFDQVMIGGVGRKASDAEYLTFESVSKTSRAAFLTSLIRHTLPEHLQTRLFRRLPLPRTSTSYQLTNLVSSRETYAARTADTRYRTLAKIAYQRMDSLALEFLESKGL